MTVVGVTMVKDEMDIIATTVGHMCIEVDHVIVADNGSTDGTLERLRQLEEGLPNLTVIEDPEPAYMQSKKMTLLAHIAGERLGADWVVPFDADEIWYSNAGRLSDAFTEIGELLACVEAELFDHVATGVDRVGDNPVERMGWRRRDPLPIPKVACRYRPTLTIHQGNHGCDFDGIKPHSPRLLVVRHFPYRSPEQFVRKVRNGAAAYAAAGDRLPESAGAHWRQWGAILDAQGEQAVVDIFKTWYYRKDPGAPLAIGADIQPPLVYDPAPIR